MVEVLEEEVMYEEVCGANYMGPLRGGFEMAKDPVIFEDEFNAYVDADDPLEKLSEFREMIQIVLDLATEIAKKTKTPIDDKTVALIHSVVERLLG